MIFRTKSGNALGTGETAFLVQIGNLKEVSFFFGDTTAGYVMAAGIRYGSGIF